MPPASENQPTRSAPSLAYSKAPSRLTPGMDDISVSRLALPAWSVVPFATVTMRPCGMGASELSVLWNDARM